jgi:hypothetical protein
MEWEEFDCSNGIIDVQPTCIEECTYEDCSSENNGEVCWVEECKDGCDIYNCTIWYQKDEVWYGEVCEEEMNLMPDVRVQDVFTGSQMLVNVYNNTIFDVLDQVCAADDIECIRAKKSINAFAQGRIVRPEVEGTEEISSMAT